MGVFCQIHLRRPRDGVYGPGDVVSGVVKYALNKDARYKDIVVCLRGKGRCSWTEGSGKSRREYTGSEDYVNVTESLLEKKSEDDEMPIAAGVYSRPFKFTFPTDVPGSYYDTVCKIEYYVKLTFQRKGVFKFNKTFRTIIPFENTTVKTALTDEAITYGAKKSLVGLFSRDEIYLKATVNKTTLAPGERLRLDVEVNNAAGLEISTVKTKLFNKVVRIANCGRTNSHLRNVEETRRATDAVKEKSIAAFTRNIEIPYNHHTILYSKILEREYFVKIKAKIPFPHLNLVLDVPIIIGNVEEENAKKVEENEYFDDLDPMSDDLPPSYWEVMQEDKATTKKCKEEDEEQDETQRKED